jgi:hypothetical protein
MQRRADTAPGGEKEKERSFLSALGNVDVEQT